MAELFELQLLEDLQDEWGTIELLLAEAPEVREELTELGRALESADADELAVLLADLFDLLEESPAADYARVLRKRAFEGLDAKVRSAASGRAVEPVEEIAPASAAELARAMRTPVVAEPMTVYFGTNRSWAETHYGAECTRLSVGRVRVSIPVRAHESGRVEVPQWWNVLSRDDRSRFLVAGEIERMADSAGFERELAAAAAARHSEDVLVVVHGFNVSFINAVRGAGQFAWNTRFAGAIVLFSWPSAGRIWSYGRDGDYAEASVTPFAEFLEMLSELPWRRIHILAHSMGNQLLVRTLARRSLPAEKLGTVAYVAPDVSRVVFAEQFPAYVDRGAHHALYTSGRDLATRFSSRLKSDRVGSVGTDDEPYHAPGLETVVATRVRTGVLSLGHSYHMTARPLMTDLDDLLNDDRPAEVRPGLRRSPHGPWWFFP